ncbi:MAG: SH3 domain-containing protein [Planctomycetota bacterium]|jgi:hypothetical protein
MFSSLRPLLLGAASAAAAVAIALPAGARQADADRSYIGVIRTEVAPVRSGADQGYYPLAQLKKGQLVQVVGEKIDWAQVRLVGPAFHGLYGYLKFEKSESGRFRLATDGRSGMTLGPAAVYAPNLLAKMDARDSWKTLVTLKTNETVTVLDTFETELDRVYKIAMPPTAQAFISLALVERATPAQEAEWRRALAAPAPPTSPPATPAETVTSTPPAAIDDAPAEPVAAAPDTTPPATPPATADAERPAVEANAAPLAIEPPPAAPDVTPPPITPEETLKQLDAALERLASEPLAQAEVEPLRNLYQDLARRAADHDRVRQYAEIRAAQLQVWADLQEHRRKLSSLKTRVAIGSEETASTRLNFETSDRYTAVGRLVASTIYTGKGLPRLMRLRDPGTGRTIAYLRPTKEFDLVGLMNQLIGVVGDARYDHGLRLNIIVPKRVDILAPQPTSM